MQPDMAPCNTSSLHPLPTNTLASSTHADATAPSSPPATVHGQDDGDLDAQPAPLVAAAASPTRTFRKRANESPDPSPSRSPRCKRVRWSTITVHEFGIGLGGSSISDRGGPSIGLADTPEFTWMTKVGEMAECSEGIHRFTPDQRTRLLKAAGVSEGMISRYARETSIILKSRRKTVAEGVQESSDEDDDDDLVLVDEGEEETDDSESDNDDDLDMYSRKRKAEAPPSVYMNRPQFLPLRRPRMIPANYV